MPIFTMQRTMLICISNCFYPTLDVIMKDFGVITIIKYARALESEPVDLVVTDNQPLNFIFDDIMES